MHLHRPVNRIYFDCQTKCLCGNGMDSMAQERVLNDLLVDTFNIILKVEQEALHIYEVEDLSVAEVHTIDAMGDGPGRSMSEIAARLGVTVATVTVAVSRLVTKGYV